MYKRQNWNAADCGYFRGGGYSSRFLTEAEMPCTMIRLNLVKGLGPVLQIAEGWTVRLPDEVSDILWKRTDYTWPCTWFAPRTTGEGAFRTAYDVMNNWGANHEMCIRDRAQGRRLKPACSAGWRACFQTAPAAGTAPQYP